MNPHKPHIIIEGSVQYSLGELKDNQMLYDFDKMLIYLNAKGKLLFGKNLKFLRKTAILFTNSVIFTSRMKLIAKN